MKGYKASYNQKCLDVYFEVGKIYKLDEKPVCCVKGFHFCQNPTDVLNYYEYDKTFVLFEVNAIGDIDVRGDKSCTNEIEIIRIIPKEEYIDLFDPNRFKMFDDLSCWWLVANGTESKYSEDLGLYWFKNSFGKEYQYNHVGQYWVQL
jgi:hypothetical protein